MVLIKALVVQSNISDLVVGGILVISLLLFPRESWHVVHTESLICFCHSPPPKSFSTYFIRHTFLIDDSESGDYLYPEAYLDPHWAPNKFSGEIMCITKFKSGALCLILELHDIDNRAAK